MLTVELAVSAKAPTSLKSGCCTDSAILHYLLILSILFGHE